jgi:hypothetical protein
MKYKQVNSDRLFRFLALLTITVRLRESNINQIGYNLFMPMKIPGRSFSRKMSKINRIYKSTTHPLKTGGLVRR